MHSKFLEFLRFWGYTSQPVYDPLHKAQKEGDAISGLVGSFIMKFNIPLLQFLEVERFWGYTFQPVYDFLHKQPKEGDNISGLAGSFIN